MIYLPVNDVVKKSRRNGKTSIADRFDSSITDCWDNRGGKKVCAELFKRKYKVVKADSRVYFRAYPRQTNMPARLVFRGNLIPNLQLLLTFFSKFPPKILPNSTKWFNRNWILFEWLSYDFFFFFLCSPWKWAYGYCAIYTPMYSWADITVGTRRGIMVHWYSALFA